MQGDIQNKPPEAGINTSKRGRKSAVVGWRLAGQGSPKEVETWSGRSWKVSTHVQINLPFHNANKPQIFDITCRFVSTLMQFIRRYFSPERELDG